MKEIPFLTEDTLSILHRLLDQSDSGRTRLQLKFNRQEVPELYNIDEQHKIDDVWSDLIELEKYNVVVLKIPKQKRQGYEIHHGGSLTLKLESESTLRHWLKRPALDPHIILWHAALDKHPNSFEDQGDALKQDVIYFLGKNYEQVAAAFASIKKELQAPLTLRQLSARCFWGESKFLDNQAKESLILSTFPSLRDNLVRRPLLLSAYVPSNFKEVIFIENQDTFLELSALNLSHQVIIYLGGYRGTAIRTREQGQTRFAYINNAPKDAQQNLHDFWLGSKQVPCYFWGDLDYAGMSILEALKKVFPTVEAWQPGYQPMLDLITQGFGHSPGVESKSRQFQPGNTGCNYCDHMLIPSIEKYGAFLDQEAIPLCTIVSALSPK